MTAVKTPSTSPRVRASEHGCLGDVQDDNNGSITAGQKIVTGGAGLFVPSDVGKIAEFPGAGVAGATLYTTIFSYQSPTQVTLVAAASTTVSSSNFWWGSDDLAAIQAIIDAFPQPGSTGPSRVGGTIEFEDGRTYGVTGTIQTAGIRRAIRLVGQGGVSANEGTVYGTAIVPLAAGVTCIEGDGSATTVEFGTQIEKINFKDPAGKNGTGRAIFFKALSRCTLRDVTIKTFHVGLELDAVGQDSAHHMLDQVHFHGCATGFLGTDHYGFTMVGGEFSSCDVGYDGIKDRHTAFEGVKSGFCNPVYRSRGHNIVWSDCYFEMPSGATPAMGWDLDALTGADFGQGAGMALHGCYVAGAGNGLTNVTGLKLGPGIKGGWFDLFIDAMATANRLVVDPGVSQSTIVPRTKDGALPDLIKNGVSYYVRSGAPEGVLAAPVGTQYLDSGTGISYRKASGSGTTGWESLSASSTPTDLNGIERTLAPITITGAIGATVTDGADFPVAVPNGAVIKRMKVTAKAAPTGSAVIKLRRSTVTTTPSYSDVPGFTVTFTSGNTEATVDPADVALNENDLLNLSVATGSGTNLFVEIIYTIRPPAPTFVGQIGTNTNLSDIAALSVTTTADVPAGDSVVIAYGTGAVTTAPAIVGGGLSWRVGTASANGAGGTICFATAYCPSGLPSGSVITITIPTTSPKKVASIFHIAGEKSIPDDGSASRNGTNTSLSTNASSTLAQPDEIAFAAYVIIDTQTNAEWSAGAGWTKSDTTPQTATNVTLLVTHQIVASTAALTGTATIARSVNYAAALITLEAG